MRFRVSVLSWIHILAASLVGLSCALFAARAEESMNDATELTVVIEEIDSVLAESKKTSFLYRTEGRLSSLDFGPMPLSWAFPGRIPANPLSKPVRTLIAHAVCWKNQTALKKLSEVNELLGGYLFDELQSRYLQNVADRLSLKLNFVGQPRDIDHVPTTDLKQINHKRRVVAALDDDRPEEALRLLSTFASLCKKAK